MRFKDKCFIFKGKKNDIRANWTYARSWCRDQGGELSPCPSGYISWYQNCYKLVEEPATWTEAQVACQLQGGNLASIDMSYDQAFVAGVVSYFLVTQEDVGWGWTDKTSLGFLNWAPGEPNAAFHPGDVAEESCVEMYHDGRWNDNNCLQKRGFVCRHRQCKFFF
uniref:C-type lectin domain-containing protein n=1 Tax=Dicentrarchus labrax TaxID=13489 RepID=A0A8C4F6M3_DICLA